MSHRAPAGLLLVLALGVPLMVAARTDPSMESLLVALDLERRARNEDVLEVERLTSAATRADAEAASARERLVDAARGGDLQAGDLRDEEERVVEAPARESDRGHEVHVDETSAEGEQCARVARHEPVDGDRAVRRTGLPSA